jgi:hypothetical protein
MTHAAFHLCSPPTRLARLVVALRLPPLFFLILGRMTVPAHPRRANLVAAKGIHRGALITAIAPSTLGECAHHIDRLRWELAAQQLTEAWHMRPV